jgi:hypothetical protein
MVDRIRNAVGEAVVQLLLACSVPLERHDEVAVAEGRAVVGKGADEAAAIVEVEPERRQHDGRADRAPAAVTLPRGQAQQTQDRRGRDPPPGLGADPPRRRRRCGEGPEGLGDGSGGLGRDVRRREQRQRQLRRRLESERPEGAAFGVDIDRRFDGERGERSSSRVDHAGPLPPVLLRGPDQPALARAAVAERGPVDLLPATAPGGGDHREEIGDLARLRLTLRGGVDDRLVQLQEVDPAQDPLVGLSHEFRLLGPVEPRGVVAPGALAERAVLLEGRLHRRDGRAAGGLDVDDVDQPVAHGLGVGAVVFLAELRRIRRPDPGQPRGDRRRQSDAIRGGCRKGRLAVRERDESGGDMLAVPPDRAVAIPVDLSSVRSRPKPSVMCCS